MDKYERGNTIKADITFKISGSAADPYNNAVTVDVLNPDDTNLITSGIATRTDTGEYKYFFSSNATSDLGIYTIVWKAQHDTGTQGLMPLTQRDYYQLVQCD